MSILDTQSESSDVPEPGRHAYDHHGDGYQYPQVLLAVLEIRNREEVPVEHAKSQFDYSEFIF